MPTKTALPSTALVSFDPAEIPIPSKLIALLGRGAELHPLILQSLFVRAARGERLGVISADNCFNAYALARLARAHGFDPADLLGRIDLSRPFTGYQLHHCVINLVEERKHQWSALCVLGLLDGLYDEDLRFADATRLLRESLVGLKQLAADGLSILVTLSPPPRETSRAAFVTRVLCAADAYWQPSPSAIEHLASPQLTLW